ncbi:hypothetical protein [Halolactibacillus sp. JCM 19043]|uniref:hypothetical protein n=1 Tax=Halolactibacillus sp. JCM 19043 TaxID=1460638 RepID=UPI0018D1EFA8|nr:hypothetical protein [Halolactibacillus sp. JCM 19043]
MGLAGDGMGIAVIPGFLLHLDGTMFHYVMVNLIAGLVPFILSVIWIKKKGNI